MNKMVRVRPRIEGVFFILRDGKNNKTKKNSTHEKIGCCWKDLVEIIRAGNKK